MTAENRRHPGLEAKSSQDFLAELDQSLVEHKATYKRIGAILLEARETLRFEEYQDLEIYLLVRGWTRGKVRICLEVAEGRVDESMIFYAERKERLVRLPQKDQARLTRDKLPLRRENGEVEEKFWSQMSAAEKLQVVGPQCDRLLPPDQQEVKTKGDRRVAYDRTTLVGDELVLNVGRRSGRISLANLVLSLKKSGGLARFLRRIRQLEKTIAATDV